MVVILIIGVLASIISPVLFKARETAKKKWALKELIELGAVISVYHLDQSAYPPDSGDWGAVEGNTDNDGFDEFSIHRYLGRQVVNWRGEEYQAYMSMNWERVIDHDPDGAGKFLDPFGEPYQLDAMHMIPPDPNNPASGYKQNGWPYRLAMKNDPSNAERLKMVLDFKFVSYGPDTQSVDYPFDMGELMNPRVTLRTGTAKDDICSWE